MQYRRKGEKLMSLLYRIAYSNGNPQRTIAALRLVNEHLAHQSAQRSTRLEAELSLMRFRQIGTSPPTLRTGLAFDRS